MKLSGENRINASPAEVWRALNDPDILRKAIPGCDTLEKIDDTHFKATVTTKIGPVQAKFTGEVELQDLNPPHGYTISGKGSGGVAGNARGAAKVKLEPDGDGTKLTYDVDAQVTGKLAQLGSRLIDSTAKMLAGQFFNKFEQLVSRPEISSAAATSGSIAGAAVTAGSTAAAGATSATKHAVQGAAGAAGQATSKAIPAWLWAVIIALCVMLFGAYFKG